MLSDLLDAIPHPVFYEDLASRTIGCNRAFVSLIGRPAADLMAARLADESLKKATPAHQCEHAPRLDGRLCEVYEDIVQAADGSLRHVEIRTAVWRNEGGQVAGIVGTITDVTAHKIAEEHLRTSHEALSLRNRLTEAFLLKSGFERFGAVVDVLLDLTKSGRGLLGYLDDEGGLVAPAVRAGVWFGPRGQEGPVRLPPELVRSRWWGRAITERRACYQNGPVPVPDGHPPLIGLMVAPVIYHERVIGLIVVADKEGGYGEPDRLTVEEAARQVAPLLHEHLITQQEEARRCEAEQKVQLSLDRLRQAGEGFLQALVVTVEARDPYTAGHQRRVARLARAIAGELGLSAEAIEAVYFAGMIHDIGKLSVPAEILSKPTSLSEPEADLVRIHPEAGHEILKDIMFPWPIATIILQHHERLDGSGYPQGLTGDQILIEARILSVADVVDASASHRPYRPAVGLETALAELAAQRGVLYDPQVVDACLRLFRECRFSF